MTDTNRPAAWRVIDKKTNAIVGEFPAMLRALAFCEELEPSEEIIGMPARYVMEPVRSCEIATAEDGGIAT